MGHPRWQHRFWLRNSTEGFHGRWDLQIVRIWVFKLSCCKILQLKIECYFLLWVPPIHRPSKILNSLNKAMHSAASLRKKERLSPSPCMHIASIWGKGTFCLDGEFSKNAPYKQKIIFFKYSSLFIPRVHSFFPCLAAQKTFFSYRNFWNKEFHFLKGKKLAILKKMAF